MLAKLKTAFCGVKPGGSRFCYLEPKFSMEDNPENASSAPDNLTDPTSALDDLTEPPCTPNNMTDTLDIRDEEVRMREKPQAEADNQHPGFAATEGEMDNWVHMEQPRNKRACALATQLEKMRLDMELTMMRYRYEDKEKQREHEEKMEELRLQAPAMPVNVDGLRWKIREEKDQ
uniref:Uncharacterized protein n=1 Tax=Sphaerodactylus townsendi TaxID=933632 RepID=A0ACB8G9F9_9SAUR